MNCQEAGACIHDYLDDQLSAADLDLLTAHLNVCARCAESLSELRALKTALGGREEIPKQISEQLWLRIETQIRWTPSDLIQGIWEETRTFFRDLDRLFVWSRVSAAPITLGFFVILLMQFSQTELYRLSYPVFGAEQPVSSSADPVVSETKVAQERAVIHGLTDTVWRIPYEDSLSLVAEITPEGKAVIENVLEYPRSTDLLAAVGQTLQEGRFESAAHLKGSFVLFSLQKIDVYER